MVDRRRLGWCVHFVVSALSDVFWGSCCAAKSFKSVLLNSKNLSGRMNEREERDRCVVTSGLPKV